MPKLVPISVIDMMAGKWAYCCRCDKEEIMAPKSLNKWECIQCGLGLTVTRFESDIFSPDQQTTPEEKKRLITYSLRLAKEKLQKVANPPPLPFRAKIVSLVARLLRVQFIRIHK